MKTVTSPPASCNAFGFTFFDADGNLCQYSYKDLKAEGLGLFAVLRDGEEFRRVRHPDDVAVTDRAWLCVAPLGSSQEEKERLAVLALPGLLLGENVDRVERIRYLASLEPAVVRASNAWNSLSETDRAIIEQFWDPAAIPGSITDAAIVRSLSGISQAAQIGSEDLLGALVTELRIPGFFTANGMSAKQQADLEWVIRNGEVFGVDWKNNNVGMEAIQRMLDRHSAAPDPLVAALRELYRLPDMPRDETLTAARLLCSGTLSAEQAASLARLVTDSTATPLLVSALRLHGANEEVLRDALSLWSSDRDAAIVKYGTAEMLIGHRFSSKDAELMCRLLNVPVDARLQGDVLRALDSIDPAVYARTLELVRSGDCQAIDPAELALRAVASFGNRAPDWLLRVSDSPLLREERLAQSLPDEATARRRIDQITKTLNTASAAGANDADTQRRIELLRVIASATTSAPGTGAKTTDTVLLLEAVRKASSDVSLLASVLPTAAAAQKRISALDGELLTADADSKAKLLETQAALRDYVAAKKADDPVRLQAAIAALASDPARLVSLLPEGKAAKQEAEKLARQNEGVTSEEQRLGLTREVELLQLYVAATATGDRAAVLEAGEALRMPTLSGVTKTIAQRTDALTTATGSKAAQLQQEIGLLESYAAAVRSGDASAVTEAGRALRQLREGDLISVHDATFWLAASPLAAVCTDGTLLGNWLLQDERGASALRGTAGRQALGLIATTWQSGGSEKATTTEVAARAMSASYGGHTDEVSRFFALNKVPRDTAERSLQIMRDTVDVPTMLPVSKLYEDASTGMKGFFLTRDDPRGLQLGTLSDCCQHLAGAGATCAVAGQSHPASGFFVVTDAAGAVVAQSWVYGTDSAFTFDNVEGRISNASAERSGAVLKLYQDAAVDMAQHFGRVTVGAHNRIADFNALPSTTPSLLSDIGYKGYSDATNQRLLYELPADAVRTVSYAGTPTGFEFTQHGAKVTVTTDGLQLSGPGARELAEQELSKGVAREFKILDGDGVATGEVLSVTAEPAQSWRADIAAAPESYSRMSEQLTLMFSEAGVPEELRQRYLESANGDVTRALKYAANGWTPEEVTQIHAYGKGASGEHILSQLVPEGLRDGSSPLASSFVSAVQAGGERAVSHLEVLQNSAIAREMLLSGSSSNLGSLVAENPVVLPLISASTDAAATWRCVDSSQEGGYRSTMRHLPVDTALAMRHLAEHGGSSMDVEVLTSMREEFNSPPPVSDINVVAAWAELPVGERLNTRLRGRGEFTLEDITTFNAHPEWQQDAALQLSNQSSRGNAAVAAQVIATAVTSRGLTDPGYAEVAQLVSDLTPNYVDTLRYVGLGPITADQILDLTTAPRSVTELRDMAASAGIYPQAGHNMPDFSFRPADAVALSHTSQERIDEALSIIREEGYVVHSTQQLATLVTSEFKQEEVRAMLGGEPNDGIIKGAKEVLMDALDREIPTDVIREAMTTPYDAAVKGMLIHTPELRTIVSENRGNDVLDQALPLLRGLPTCTRTDTDALSWLIKHAEESESAHAAVFEALEQTPDARIGKSPWQHAVMRVLDGSKSVPRRLGGVSSAKLPGRKEADFYNSWI
jgi:hypothetical protein